MRKFKFVKEFKATEINSRFLVIDIETTGLNPREDKIMGVAFTTKPGVGYYTTDIKNFFDVVQKSKCELIMHNAVFDYSFIKQAGWTFKNRIHDTMVLASIINPDRPTLHLKELAVEVLGPGTDAASHKMYQWLADNHLEKDSITKAPAEILVPYAAEDAVNTYELFVKFCKKIAEINRYFATQQIKENPWEYYLRECCDLIPVVVDMQLGGVKLDLEATATKKKDLKMKMIELEQELTTMNRDQINKAEELLHQKKIDDRIKKNKTGKLKKIPPRVAFNWDSNDHLKLLFLKICDLPITKKTKKGNASVDASFLETLKGKLPWINKLLEYKELKKLTSTYLSGLLERQEGGYIHANFNIAGTATGRFSSSNPNLQNLPKHGGIKSLFVPRPGHRFIYADYSQLELRIAAHLSGDPELCAEYAKDSDGTVHSDVHQKTADALKIDRATAKNINFAIIYNASGWRIAEMMGWMDGIGICTNPEGRCPFKNPCEVCAKKKTLAKKGDEIVKVLMTKYKGLQKLVDNQRAFMLRYLITISHFGKLRRLLKLQSEVRSEYNHALKAGFNLPIQSFGASLCKRSMVRLFHKGYRIVNQIHDSLVVEVPEGQLEDAVRSIKNVMESIFQLRVPLVVEPKILTSFEEKQDDNDKDRSGEDSTVADDAIAYH